MVKDTRALRTLVSFAIDALVSVQELFIRQWVIIRRIRGIAHRLKHSCMLEVAVVKRQWGGGISCFFLARKREFLGF